MTRQVRVVLLVTLARAAHVDGERGQGREFGLAGTIWRSGIHSTAFCMRCNKIAGDQRDA